MGFRDKQYIYRKNFTNILKDLYRLLFHYEDYYLHLRNKSEKIQVERYNEGVIEFNGYSVNYIDYASFESTVNEIFLKKIYSFKAKTEKPLIIDCGANIGLSILFFKQLYPDAVIKAFEADPKVFACLQKNMDSFNITNVELVNKALWDSVTNLSFFSEGADAGRVDEEIYGDGEMINVETTCLSNYLDKKIDFLKIDIEGAEYKVLLESKHFLKNVDHLFVEYHSFRNKPQFLNEILNLLSDSGFRYYVSSIGVRSDTPFLNLNEVLGMDNQLNIFAYKSDVFTL